MSNPRSLPWRPRVVSLMAGLAAIVGFTILLTGTAHAQTDVEQCFLDKINAERAATGAGSLAWASDIAQYTRDHSASMASAGELFHSSHSALDAALPSGWSAWGENVGWHSHPALPDCTAMHDAFMDSSGHRDNLLNPTYTFAATGVHVDGSGGLWTTHVFFSHPSYGGSFVGTFSDDDGSTFEDEIEALVAAQITQGCGNNLFCPDAVVTRGQMAAFLSRALNLPDAGSAGFTDVGGSTFENDINRIAAVGITSGCGGTNYCPDDLVSRGQMAAFLTRALNLPDAAPAGFLDTSGITFESFIDAVAAAGITNGCGNNYYCPDAPVTRGQMAAFLVRALDL